MTQKLANDQRFLLLGKASGEDRGQAPRLEFNDTWPHIPYAGKRKVRTTMQVTLQIPDDIGCRLAEMGENLSRRALEGWALQELKAGRITEPELGRMLGLARLQIDGFLKAHGVYPDITIEDIDRDLADLKSLGF